MRPRLQDVDQAGAILQQDAVNRAVYFSPRVYRDYLCEMLQPAEVACLLKYQPHLAGRDVLDVGVGAGRTTRYLAPLASRYEAMDYSPVMVGYMRQAFPEVSVREADFRDLRAFPAQAFDFMFATDNVIDALSHDDRCRALKAAWRVLRPGGLLALSSHNANYVGASSRPHLEWSRNPVTMVANLGQLLRRHRNHRRVGRLRKVTPEYALLNDEGHDYALLHYYVARTQMQVQLKSAGLRLMDVFDIHGQLIEADQDDQENSSLFYVAERQED